MTSPLLLGHRGARANRAVHENTLSSFDLAVEHGCDGFEFDLRLTACGRALVCHNPTVGGLRVSRATHRQLTHLPCLEDVLKRYSRRVFLDIELKVAGLESKALVALHEYPPERGCVVSSFLPHVVLELRARSAVLPVGIICEKKSQLARWEALPVDFVIVQEALVNEKLVQEVHRANRKLFVWTVNRPTSMQRLAEWGADGIISDDTQLLVNTLKGAPRA